MFPHHKYALLQVEHVKKSFLLFPFLNDHLGRVKRIWYLSLMRAVKVQASLRIHPVSPEPLLLAPTSSDSRGTFRQKARSLAPLNGWACAVKICHNGMLEDTNSLDGAHLLVAIQIVNILTKNSSTESGVASAMTMVKVINISSVSKHMVWRLCIPNMNTISYSNKLVPVYAHADLSILKWSLHVQKVSQYSVYIVTVPKALISKSE